MSYYILPKINNIINIQPKDCNDNECEIYISHSLFNYYNKIIQEINNTINNENNNHLQMNYKDIITLVNPYEYIFSKVPDSKYSVSKLKQKSYLFYDLLEIIVNLDIFENFKNESITSLYITNNNDVIECYGMLREKYDDEVLYFNEINDNMIKLIDHKKFNFLFFETKTTNLKEYIISLMESIMIILNSQNKNGHSIIKVNTMFHKPIIDMLYFLSSLFEKVYILKPNTNNVTTFEKYIICKNFKISENKMKIFKANYYRIIVFLKKIENKNIISFINFDVPYYFFTKVNDINNIMSQQQLESLDLIISLLKNKNKYGKIETIQKTNIQKSVLWCEKFKIPCNKFFEKTNIFLPISKKNKEEENAIEDEDNIEMENNIELEDKIIENDE